MTPEERFTRIETNLERVSQRMDGMTEAQARRQAQLDKQLKGIHEAQARHQAQLDKHLKGIQDLIVVSRTLLDSVKELRDAQKDTDEKLNILIDTVDKIIRHRNGGSPDR
ncbi:MAG: hypothetical protein HY646_22805 [Acidobacteria bacterium]|nr:hypothetical protein [Acidobacteriota bacterium]